MKALYGMKFIAFLGIFFHHLAFPYSMGAMLTTYFFVFAGFILAYSIDRKKIKFDKENIKKFYLDKILKNYPTYLLTLFISIPIVEKVEGFSFGFGDIIYRILMLQTISPIGKEVFMFNGLSWFLVDLLFIYLLIPLVYNIIRKFKIEESNKKLLFLAFFVFLSEITFSLLKTGYIEIYSKSWWLYYISPFSRFLNVLFGLVLGILFVKNKNKIEKFFENKSILIVSVAEFFCLVLMILSNKLYSFIPNSFYSNGTINLIPSIISIYIFAIGKGYISKILSNKIFVYFGKLSLSCYMLHQVIINYIPYCFYGNPWYKNELSFLNNLFSGLCLLLVVLLISDVFEKYIIVPMTKYINKIITKIVILKNKINIKPLSNKYKKMLLWCVTLLFYIIGINIFISIIFNNVGELYKHNYIIIFILTFIYLLFMLLLHKVVVKIKISSKKLFIIFMGIYFIIQVLMIIFIKVIPTWDFGVVLNAVSDDLNNIISLNRQIYLYQFQNNVLFAYLLKIIMLPFSFLGIKDFLIPAIMLNIICIDIGIYFIFKTIKKIFKDSLAKLFIMFLFFFVPLLLYVPIVYTDTVAFSLVAILTYMILSILTEDKEVKNNRVYVSMGIIFGIALKIKFTIIILLIAFVLILIIFNSKKIITNSLLILIGLLIIIIPINVINSLLFDDAQLNKNKVPATHWIMMGLKNNGNFNSEDYAMTFESGDYAKKTAFNKNEIIKRLKAHINNNSMISFYSRKISFLWGDGTYYLPELLRNYSKKSFMHEFVLTNGKYFSFFSYLLQIKHIFMLIMAFILPINTIKNKKFDLCKLFLITVFVGIFLFFIIWEVSSRYLLHMLPVFIIMCCYGIKNIVTFRKKEINEV